MLRIKKKMFFLLNCLKKNKQKSIETKYGHEGFKYFPLTYYFLFISFIYLFLYSFCIFSLKFRLNLDFFLQFMYNEKVFYYFPGFNISHTCSNSEGEHLEERCRHVHIWDIVKNIEIWFSPHFL